ncbi:DSBA-like thioredoxin domain protein [Polystyrenella longa]|uniref:DSBA-like thioredoxin domain protein n=1 Tax=Polystyrenella longa TaxID=2528007 RepID=A0A518CMN3_9PLAN|nr:DsbA family protein [Polystyrenella longa]QDU80485.1 DSBA-like thioredoxin domain protein [Polystyrenella longa]
MTITVDVISDVICPWCYIGKRRLEKAIRVLDGKNQVQVHWHPFQLNPTMPKEGIPRKEYRTRKFGSWERSLELDAQVIAVGESEGIHFAFDKTKRTPNTVDAHRLIWLAGQNNCQDAVVEALFRAYFTEGRDIGNRKILIDVATDVGLDPKSAELMFNNDEGPDVILKGRELSQQHNVDSVPFFIVNKEVTLSGAQEPETFLQAFNVSNNNSRPTKLLFVCSKNKWRSLTAERILDGVNGFDVRSAGTENDARIKVTAGHIGWADKIFVMEKKHRRRLEAKFGDSLSGKEVVCLNIPDDYKLMDPALVDLLLEKLSPQITIPD